MDNLIWRIGAALALFASISTGQQTDPANPSSIAAPQPPAEAKRIFGLIPNYRTAPSIQNYKPLTNREKFKVASQDAFDRGTIGLAAFFAGESQLTNANASFGQGGLGFGKYFAAAYGDLVIGDYMTEAVFPILLHQDPRYFRRGTGGGKARLGYAAGQIFRTHRDQGGTQFNYSEVLGNSAAVAISQIYYKDNRTASDAVTKLSLQLAVDMTANILKEFWPDIERRMSRKHHPQPSNSSN